MSAINPGFYERHHGHWQYYDGDEWVGPAYKTKAAAIKGLAASKRKNRIHRWLAVLSVLVVILIISALVMVLAHRRPSDKAPAAAPTRTYSQDYGGIKSQKMNDDGSSSVSELANGDFTPMDIGSDGIVAIADGINKLVLQGNCKNLKQEYSSVQDVSCPVSSLPADSHPQYGYQAQDKTTGNYRINGAYTGDKAGGFVIILNSSKELISYSYIRYIPAI